MNKFFRNCLYGFFAFAVFYSGVAFCADIENPYAFPQSQCAHEIFAGSLQSTAGMVDENDPEHIIETWIYAAFQSPDVVREVLNCADVKTLADDDDLIVPAIEYEFPQGRRIIINYATQPKVLKQRLMLDTKRAMFDGLASAKIDPADGNVWINTEPAWYGILVVQSGALDKYVGSGPDKFNTLSVDYLVKNIDEFYPKNSNTGDVPATIPMCTTGSAFADDDDIINIAAHMAAGYENGTGSENDFYIAGDVNLQWITWAEVAADVAITVATFGTGTAVMGAARGVRAARTAKSLRQMMGSLRKIDKVRDYEVLARNIKNAENALDTTRKAIEAEQDLVRIAREIQPLSGARANSARLAQRYGKTIEKIEDIKKLDIVASERKIAELGRDVARNDGAIKLLNKNADELAQIDDVKKYKQAAEAFDKVADISRNLKAWRVPQRGNIIARMTRTNRAMSSANRTIGAANKIGRGSLGSVAAKAKDWLFHSTARWVARGGRVVKNGGLLFGALTFVGDMYDWTETATGEYTSGLEFMPIGLLSADDLTGQENVVNHGMWLMWVGDSLNALDDDAAFLQAMDFAAKFHEDMMNAQSNLAQSRDQNQLCDVDIYVVRPIIRNPDTEDSLFYLIMNDTPWKVRLVQDL